MKGLYFFSPPAEHRSIVHISIPYIVLHKGFPSFHAERNKKGMDKLNHNDNSMENVSPHAEEDTFPRG